MIYPISYSIPSECFCKTKTKKIIDIAKLVPGKLDTYIYNDQETYYNRYISTINITTTMNNETYLMYYVTIRSVSRENAGKCESVMGQMPTNIHVMSNQVTTPGCFTALRGNNIEREYNDLRV